MWGGPCERAQRHVRHNGRAGAPPPSAPLSLVSDWLTCFPGFAMLSTAALVAPCTTTRACGELVEGSGVRLRWPDGVETPAVGAHVTGLGSAA